MPREEPAARGKGPPGQSTWMEDFLREREQNLYPERESRHRPSAQNFEEQGKKRSESGKVTDYENPEPDPLSPPASDEEALSSSEEESSEEETMHSSSKQPSYSYRQDSRRDNSQALAANGALHREGSHRLPLDEGFTGFRGIQSFGNPVRSPSLVSRLVSRGLEARTNPSPRESGLSGSQLKDTTSYGSRELAAQVPRTLETVILEEIERLPYLPLEISDLPNNSRSGTVSQQSLESDERSSTKHALYEPYNPSDQDSELAEPTEKQAESDDETVETKASRSMRTSPPTDLVFAEPELSFTDNIRHTPGSLKPQPTPNAPTLSERLELPGLSVRSFVPGLEDIQQIRPTVRRSPSFLNTPDSEKNLFPENLANAGNQGFYDNVNGNLGNQGEDLDRSRVYESESNDSGLSDAESIMSMAISVASSASSIGDLPDSAISGFTSLLLKDDDLKDLLGLAMTRVGPVRFQRNLRRLLIRYGHALRQEVTRPLEIDVARFVRHSSVKVSIEVRDRVLSATESSLVRLDPVPDPETLESLLPDYGDLSDHADSSEEEDADEETEVKRGSSFSNLDKVESFLISSQAFINFRNGMEAWVEKMLIPPPAIETPGRNSDTAHRERCNPVPDKIETTACKKMAIEKQTPVLSYDSAPAMRSCSFFILAIACALPVSIYTIYTPMPLVIPDNEAPFASTSAETLWVHRSWLKASLEALLSADWIQFHCLMIFALVSGFVCKLLIHHQIKHEKQQTLLTRFFSSNVLKHFVSMISKALALAKLLILLVLIICIGMHIAKFGMPSSVVRGKKLDSNSEYADLVPVFFEAGIGLASLTITWRKPLWNSLLDWMQPTPPPGHGRISWTCVSQQRPRQFTGGWN